MKRKIVMSSGYCTRLISAILIFSLSWLASSCFLQFDRKTTIYGTVTDQKNQPVDSILIMVRGKRVQTSEIITEVYTNKDGYYEISFHLSKRYIDAMVLIPAYSSKYQKYFKGHEEFRNVGDSSARELRGCKTEYNFQLIPK